MGFRFALASVLGFRESIERREELALKKIQLEMARVQHEIEQVNAELSRAQQMREEHMRTPISAAQLQAMLSGAEATAERKKTLLESLAVLEQQRAEQMTVYQAAHRARRMLSDLQAQQKEAWEQEQARRQQKTIDDIFASRNLRG